MSDTFKIMVVEDNDFVRMQLCKFLADAGHETVEAIAGDDALEKMTDDIELAIVDVRMEPVGGFEFIRKMHAVDIKIPVILATGDNDPDLLSEASFLGVAAVLMKPVEKDRLIETVRRAMKKRAVAVSDGGGSKL